MLDARPAYHPAPSLMRAVLASALSTLALIATGSAHAAEPVSPTWAAHKADAALNEGTIVRFLGDLAIVSMGTEVGIAEGATFHVYRSSKASRRAGEGRPVWVETGRLKAVEVHEGQTIATIESQGSRLSSALFPRFEGVMAGDRVVRDEVTLARRVVVTPTVTLGYFDIFRDPKSQPSSFELTDAGMAELREAARAFESARLSLLMVEGYTDHNGPAHANQVESYQRAMTVRQFLIDELGFDEKRVVAIGYGELEPADPSMVAGYVKANRRIVLKSMPR